MSEELCLERYNLKSVHQKEAMALAKKYGERIGRPKMFDDEIIKMFRSEGLSYRSIAAKLGCSTSVISRALKPAKPEDANE
jgi:DNA invertase Pin-like site-specific DNA recombinase